MKRIIHIILFIGILICIGGIAKEVRYNMDNKNSPIKLKSDTSHILYCNPNSMYISKTFDKTTLPKGMLIPGRYINGSWTEPVYERR